MTNFLNQLKTIDKSKTHTLETTGIKKKNSVFKITHEKRELLILQLLLN